MDSNVTYFNSVGSCFRIAIQYRYFNDYNWFFPSLLVIMALLFELAAINLMDILGDFYLTLTNNDKEGFTKVLLQSLMVTSLISVLFSIQSYASEACALQWRERLVRILQSMYLVDSGSVDGQKHRSQAKTGAALQADQWITQNTDRLTTQVAKFLEKSLAIPFLTPFAKNLGLDTVEPKSGMPTFATLESTPNACNPLEAPFNKGAARLATPSSSISEGNCGVTPFIFGRSL